MSGKRPGTSWTGPTLFSIALATYVVAYFVAGGIGNLVTHSHFLRERDFAGSLLWFFATTWFLAGLLSAPFSRAFGRMGFWRCFGWSILGSSAGFVGSAAILAYLGGGAFGFVVLFFVIPLIVVLIPANLLGTLLSYATVEAVSQWRDRRIGTSDSKP